MITKSAGARGAGENTTIAPAPRIVLPWLTWAISIGMLAPMEVGAEELDDSMVHRQRAAAMIEIGDHAGGIQELELAFAAKPDAALLYDLGRQSWIVAEIRALSDMRSAVDFFERYLASAPEAPNRGEVLMAIGALRTRISAAETLARDIYLRSRAVESVDDDDPKRSRGRSTPSRTAESPSFDEGFRLLRSANPVGVVKEY
jgi:hypothetical protein